MENRIIFHHVFKRYNIPDGLDDMIIRRKK
jgi:hypothetical protein